jgi:Lipocalin-like domain
MNVHTKAPIFFAALAATLFTACKGAEPPESTESPASPLEGAWSVVSIGVSGPDSAANTTVRPSVYLFTGNHYSMMRVTGNKPRALAANDSATDAEKLAAYDSFVANAGTYDVADSTITIHPLVARSPNYMSGGSDKYHFRISGDTLWLVNTGTDFKTMIGGQLVTPAGRPSATMQVLVRQK